MRQTSPSLVVPRALQMALMRADGFPGVAGNMAGDVRPDAVKYEILSTDEGGQGICTHVLRVEYIPPPLGCPCFASCTHVTKLSARLFRNSCRRLVWFFRSHSALSRGRVVCPALGCFLNVTSSRHPSFFRHALVHGVG